MNFTAVLLKNTKILYKVRMVGKVSPGKTKLLKVQVIRSYFTESAWRIDADLVVLAAAIEPDKSARPLATMPLRQVWIQMISSQRLTRSFVLLKALTAGVFLSGACQGPKDIPETYPPVLQRLRLSDFV